MFFEFVDQQVRFVIAILSDPFSVCLAHLEVAHRKSSTFSQTA